LRLFSGARVGSHKARPAHSQPSNKAGAPSFALLRRVGSMKPIPSKTPPTRYPRAAGANPLTRISHHPPALVHFGAIRALSAGVCHGAEWLGRPMGGRAALFELRRRDPGAFWARLSGHSRVGLDLGGVVGCRQVSSARPPRPVRRPPSTDRMNSFAARPGGR
jgi:hypothetical protein